MTTLAAHALSAATTVAGVVLDRSADVAERWAGWARFVALLTRVTP